MNIIKQLRFETAINVLTLYLNAYSRFCISALRFAIFKGRCTPTQVEIKRQVILIYVYTRKIDRSNRKGLRLTQLPEKMEIYRFCIGRA